VIAPPLPVIGNLREFVFATLADSYQLTSPILAADRAAIAGRDEYDDTYFAAFFTKTQPILEKRVGEATAGTAAAIASAWAEAGKPTVSPDAPPRLPRKVRRADGDR
jgi:hypothetical protein